MKNCHTFFQNRECEYFPCHKTERDNLTVCIKSAIFNYFFIFDNIFDNCVEIKEKATGHP